MSETQAEGKWQWREGTVDGGEEHIEIRYGDAEKIPYTDWVPIARLGKPEQKTFPVQWLLAPESPKNQAMIDEVRQDLDFFLVDKGEADPWWYARYRCRTGANMYSPVHWAHYPKGQGGTRVSSMVVKLSAEQAEELFGQARKRKPK